MVDKRVVKGSKCKSSSLFDKFLNPDTLSKKFSYFKKIEEKDLLKINLNFQRCVPHPLSNFLKYFNDF